MSETKASFTPESFTHRCVPSMLKSAEYQFSSVVVATAIGSVFHLMVSSQVTVSHTDQLIVKVAVG